tara:strand:+ start:494 stop:874 length:381 start_codon:yes stop_codon:yes gene_type:complete
MIKKPQYPKHEIWFDEESKKYLMVFDGLDGVPIPFSLELSEIGAETIKTAFVNTPIHLATGNFWGYKDFPENEVLVNCEPPEQESCHIFLASYDLSALTALAKMLADCRCWQERKYTLNTTKIDKN